MAEPTDDQLKSYLDKIPEIYREILREIPKQNLKRRRFDFIQESTIVMNLASEEHDVRIQDLQAALEELKRLGFLELAPYGLSSLHSRPTTLGERAIEMLTGNSAKPASILPLPEPSWAK
ncbi:MAG: hypothetical protein ACRC8S_20265 [Fimbriiglobus sp.]